MNNETLDRLNKNLSQLRDRTRESGGAQPSQEQQNEHRRIVSDIVMNSAELAAQAKVPQREAIDTFERGYTQSSGSTTETSRAAR